MPQMCNMIPIREESRDGPSNTNTLGHHRNKKALVEHCTPHADGTPLHFTGLSYLIYFNDKGLPVTYFWQSVEEVAFRFNLQ